MSAKPASRTRRDKDDTNNPDIALSSVGNYVFQKTVGEGNFAKVKLAKHKLTNAEVSRRAVVFSLRCSRRDARRCSRDALTLSDRWPSK